MLVAQADVYSFMQVAADDSYGNIVRITAAADRFIKNFCGRDFEQATYREIYSGQNHDEISLASFPVTSIRQVALGQKPAVRIWNTNPSGQALVTVVAPTDAYGVINGMSTALQLDYYGTALAPVSSTLTFNPNYLTFGLLVAAINALGNGWNAELQNDQNGSMFNNRCELLLPNLGMDVVSSYFYNLNIPDTPVQGYVVSQAPGVIRYMQGWSDPFQSPYFGVEQPSAVINSLAYAPTGWPGGVRNIFITYVAGYAPTAIPLDLQMALFELVQFLYQKNQERAVGLDNYSIAGLAKKYQSRTALVMETLAKYRKINL